MSDETSKKWTRRNLIALWDGQPWSIPEERESNMAECDRIMIALYRFQTDGKVAYRRLLGMHGGGGGTSNDRFRKILTTKVDKDILGHSEYKGNYPDRGYWPNPVPNAAPPVLVETSNPNRCFAYTFCWHAQPEFLLWHRPLMAEFERGLQDHDPKYDDERRYSGPDAVAAPYWAWEGWDGTSLPQPLANPTYVVKTDAWKNQGYPKGSIFPNPYHRWFAPVSLEDQTQEVFESTLSDSNTTTRDSAFTDPGAEFTYVWESVSAPRKPSMNDVVQGAMHNRNWLEFCTMNADVGSSTWSIENAHNKFHNHIGGQTKGGIQGSGAQKAKEAGDYTGTMSQNQSIFDPIFFLHHSNVDRQLFSWQLRYAREDMVPDPESVPSNKLMARVLYPWTKPGHLFQGNLSWNTASSESSDATFQDWWPYSTLPYKYDQYLDPPAPGHGKKFAPYTSPGRITPNVAPAPEDSVGAIRMKVFVANHAYKGGEYALYFTPQSTGKRELVGTISVLSGVGGVCAQCSSRSEAPIAYEVSDTFKTIDGAEEAFKSGELSLTRNDVGVDIKRIEVVPWY